MMIIYIYSESIEDYLLTKVDTYSKKNLPVHIKPTSSHLSIIPFGLTLTDIELLPKGELNNTIAPFKIKSALIKPSIISLLFGKLWLASISLEGMNIEIEHLIKQSKSNSKGIEKLESILRKIPLSEINLKKVTANIKVKDTENTYKVHLDNLALSLTNQVSHFLAKVDFDEITFVENDSLLIKETSLSTQFFMTNKNLSISQFILKDRKNKLAFTGTLRHSLKNKKLHETNLNIQANTSVEQIKKYLKLFKVDIKNIEKEPLKSKIKTDVNVHATSLKNFQVEGQIVLDQFQYEKFHFDHLEVRAETDSDQKEIKIIYANATSKGISAQLSPFVINMNGYKFEKAKVNIEKLQLGPFLDNSLKVQVPAKATAQLQAICEGALVPFRILCPGTAKATNMSVSPNPDKPLIALKSITAKGEIKIDIKKVSFSTKLTSVESTGQGSGTVHYKKGFDIQYSSDHLVLDEINKISGIEIGGVSRVQGSTKGNSESATFTMKTSTENFLFSKYALGAVNSNISYKSGMLYVERAQGTVASTRFLGNLAINLRQNNIKGRIQLPFADLGDVQEAVKDHLKIPAEVSGSGSAIVDVDSSLDSNKLSFQLKSRLYNCFIEKQHIDNIDLIISAKEGLLDFTGTQLEEKSSKASIDGKLNLKNNQIDLKITSPRVSLKDISALDQQNPILTGSLKGLATVNGTLNNIDFTSNLSSDNMELSKQPISPISAVISTNNKERIVSVNSPNHIDIVLKDIVNKPFYKIDGNATKLNLSSILANMVGIDVTEGYKISNSSNFDLKLRKNDPTDISGIINIQKILFEYNNSSISNEKDISLFFDRGRLSFSPFSISSKRDKIYITSKKSKYPIDIQVAGVFRLSYLQIFTPFLETLEGLSSSKINLKSNYKEVDLTGSTFIDDAFVRIPAIKHPIEDLKIDILFNHRDISINSIRGTFAEGDLLGNGNVSFGDFKKPSVDISAKIDDMKLEIPDKVATNGNVSLNISGKPLPLKIAGTYTVKKALITKELLSASSSVSETHEIFLPEKLRKKTDSPVLLDLNIIPRQPMKIRNSIVTGAISGSLRVLGTPESPYFAGDISLIKDTDITFKEITFNVVNSNISFKKQNPPNPEIYLQANTRYLSYDIDLEVLGKASDPRFNLSSQPTLSKEEIISLLTLGYTNNTFETVANNNNGDTQSRLEIGTGLLANNPLGEFKNRFGFDIQFSSSFDEETSVATPKIAVSYPLADKATLTFSTQTGAEKRYDAKLRYDLRRDLSATMSLEERNSDVLTNNNGTAARTNILGIDMEYRLEFD